MFWYFPPDAGQLNLIFNICVTYMTANDRIIILVWTEWIIFNAKIQTLWSVSWGQTYSCIIRYKEVSCVLFCKQLISVSQKWSTFHLSKMVDVFFIGQAFKIIVAACTLNWSLKGNVQILWKMLLTQTLMNDHISSV